MFDNSTYTKDTHLLKPKNDFVFQCLFSAKNEEITKDFISALLNEKIESIKINDTKDLYRELPDDKFGILDLEAEVNGIEKVDIEVQLMKQDDFIERLLFYFSRLYEMQLHKGDKYLSAKKIILIAIIDFDLDVTKAVKEMETQFKLFDKKHFLELTDKLEIDIIELRKARETYMKDKQNLKSQWIMFVNNTEDKEVSEIMESNKSIEKAVVTVKEMSQDEKLKRIAFLREKYERDQKSIYHTGLSDGQKQEAIKIIKNLINQTFSIAQIASIVDMSEEEVCNIIKSFKKIN